MIISSKELAESIRRCGLQIATDAEIIVGNFKRRKSLSINIYWDEDTGTVPNEEALKALNRKVKTQKDFDEYDFVKEESAKGKS